MEKRILNYWTRRTEDFSKVRVNELNDEISSRWLDKINEYIPKKSLSILDLGTGVGYFAILLAKQHHHVTAIDLTPSMINKAKQLARQEGVDINFQVMNALALEFEDDCFDVIVTRNLTWTLPDSKQAYQEMHRVLKPGGLLLNFDACYSKNVINNKKNGHHVPVGKRYGHLGMNDELEQENAMITLAMDISRENRPQYDMAMLHQCHFSEYGCQVDVGKQILQDHDLKDAPMFLVWARK